MSYTNYLDSQKDVVSTIAPVILEWMRLVSEEMNGGYVVMEPSQDYQAAIEELRKKNNMMDRTLDKVFPFLAFTRMGLRAMEGTSAKRITHVKVTQPIEGNNVAIYAHIQGMFDIEFTYYVQNLADLETFEIVYNTEKGLPAIRELIIDTDIGEIKYYTRWRELGDITYDKEANQYVAITGGLYIYGPFFNFQSESGRITDINLTFYEQIFNKELETLVIN